MGTAITMDEKLPVNTIVKSPFSINIPIIDLASYVFSSGTTESRGIPQYYDAESPSQNFSLEQAEIRVKQLAKGLQTLGLQPGDRVLLFSSNRLLFPIVLWGVAAARCVFTAIAPSASALGMLG
jgi:acyl-CoA synthetase (AMP-forming)/AMP-acid ligase II